MTTLELARAVYETKGAHLFRPRKDAPGQYDAKHYFDGGSKRGWTVLDLFTASAVVQVWEKLNERNRATFEAMPIDKAARVALKLIA